MEDRGEGREPDHETLRISNHRDASDSDGISRFIYLDAIGSQAN